MHIAALSAGGQAPRGRFNGAVHSVFRDACNIRLDDGRMLTLLTPRLGNTPHGVRLDAPKEFDFTGQVRRGQRAGCRADVLRIPGALSVDLATARPWPGELPAAGVDLADPMVARAWRAAWRALQHDRPHADGTDAKSLTRAVDRQGLRLARAARALQADEATGALDRLIGRGPGLTPSGDDLIVGLLAGLWSTTGVHSARRAFLRTWCAAVQVAAAATGEISRAYLGHAAGGHFAELLIRLVHQIGEGAERRAIEASIAAALRVGHTSGGDGAFGLLLGLAAWAPRSPRALRQARHATAKASLEQPGSRAWVVAVSREAASPCLSVPKGMTPCRRPAGRALAWARGASPRSPAPRRMSANSALSQ